MFHFKKNYLLITVTLFITEVCIARYVHDTFVRPFVGDILVVILIYCFLKIFLNASVHKLALSVLAFAVGVEVLQFFNLTEHLQIAKGGILYIALGSTFDLMDILAYTTGIVLILITEKLLNKKN